MGRNQVLATSVSALLLVTSHSMLAYAQQYPNSGAYPQTQYPTQTQGGAPKSAMRQIFAASLAAVVAASGGAAVTAVSAGLNGAITGWLDRKSRPKTTYGMNYGPQGSGYPGASSYPGGGNAPDYSQYPSTGGPPSGGAGYPSSYPGSDGYPSDSSQPSYPPQNSGDSYPSYPGESSGQNGAMPSSNGDPNSAYPGSQSYPGSQGYPGAQPGSQPGSQSYPGAGSVYAGLAYEIHLLSPGGGSVPVDPASHVFRTGDRFEVLYRPSLPGQVDVFNVNAAGQSSQIDKVNVGAGQLASLGPYEFSDLTGNETLILQLSPCSSAANMTTTRNIVKVGGAPTMNPQLQLSACGGTATRGLRTKTRDIRKVATEQGTSFALDQLAPAELRSGDVAPRQVTITLAHSR